MKKEIFHLLSNWFFLVSTFSLIIHQILQKGLKISVSFFDNYGDDFFAMPFILTLFLAEQYLWKRRTTPLSTFEIFTFTLLFSTFFEFIVPIFNPNYTTDYWDFLAYISGSFAFHLLINTQGLHSESRNN